MPENNQFLNDPEQTAIAQGMKPPGLVGALVMPVQPVGKSEFTYHILDPELESFKASDAALGATAIPNEVKLGMKKETGATKDWGLSHWIPQKKIDEAPTNYNSIEKASESLTKRIWNGHESRVVAAVKKTGNYATANVQSLASGDLKKFSNDTALLLPMLLELLEIPLLRPNQAVLGRDVFTALRTHPSIVKAVSISGTDAGRVTKEALADLLELDEILVGAAFVNISKNKTPDMQKIWKGVFAAHHINAGANPGMEEEDATWGFTPLSYDLEVGSTFDAMRGTRGAVGIKVAAEMHELVTSKDAGLLLTNVL